MSEPATRKAFPWGWVACGCFAVALLVGIPVVWLGVVGLRTVRGFEDPESLTRNVRDALGVAEVPEGWTPRMAVALPVIGDIVVLEADGEQLLYLSGARLGRDPEALDRGEADLLELLDSGQVRVSTTRREPVASGRFDAGDLRVDWVALAGRIDIEQVDLDDDEVEPGRKLTTAMVLRCPGDTGRKVRLALWGGVEPPEGGASGLSGTVADESRLSALVSTFDLCR